MPIDSTTASTNGNGRPAISADALESMLTRPISLGYHPRMPLSYFWDEEGVPSLPEVIRYLEPMLAHPVCRIAMSYYKGSIADAEVKVTRASSPRVGHMAQEQFDKFWSRSRATVQTSYDYGWGGFEPVYSLERGYLGFDYLIAFHPHDCYALVKNSELAGVRVTNITAHGSQGHRDLWSAPKSQGYWMPVPGTDPMEYRWVKNEANDWPSKGFWFPHAPRYERHYGITQLYGAYRPWRRLAGRDGGEEVIDGGVYRFAYTGPILRYDPKGFRTTFGTPDPQDGRELGREFVENAKAGVGIAFPSVYGPDGKPLWDLQWPDHTIDVSHLIDYAQGYLEKQIIKGIGVPPELLEASDTGSGYSGRAIPLEGYIATQQDNLDAIVRAWRDQIGLPIIRFNCGPDAWFEIEAEPLLKTKMQSRQGQGAPAGAGQSGSTQGPVEPPTAGQDATQRQPSTQQGSRPNQQPAGQSRQQAQFSVRAPAGGVTIGGEQYEGGEFIPAEVVNQATPDEKRQLNGDEPAKKPAEKPESHPGLDAAEKSADEILARATEVPAAKRTIVEKGLGSIVPLTIDQFKRWLESDKSRAAVNLGTGFDETEHPRGQPSNAGEFAKKEGGNNPSRAEVADKMPPMEKILAKAKYVGPRQVTPVNVVGHHAGSKKRLDEITASMKADGWQGLPLLAMKRDDQWQALTGSHRLVAAERADLDTIPVVFVDHDDVLDWAKKAGYDLPPDADLTDLEDEDREKIILAGNDSVAKHIMSAEFDKQRGEFAVSLDQVLGTVSSAGTIHATADTYRCETCGKPFRERPSADKCPECSGDVIPERTWTEKYGPADLATRAPVGGITLTNREGASKLYKGGQFIPEKDLKELPKDQKEKLDAAKEAEKTKLRDRGHAGGEKLKEQLGKYSHVEMSKGNLSSAKRAYAALKTHHGELLPHALAQRIEQDERDLSKTAEESGQRIFLEKRLRAYQHMLEWAERDGMELKAADARKIEEAKAPEPATPKEPITPPSSEPSSPDDQWNKDRANKDRLAKVYGVQDVPRQDVDYLYAALDRADRKVGGHNLVHFADVAAELPGWSKDRFHQAATRARVEGAVSATPQEGRHGQTERDKEWRLEGDRSVEPGTSLLYLSKKDGYKSAADTEPQPPSAGFTGTTTDSLGREYHWVDGKRVAKPEEPAKIEAPKQEPANVEPAAGADGTGPEGSPGRRGAVVGGTDGGSPGGSGGPAQPGTGRIVTARSDLTRPGNTDLVPEVIRKHLDAHQLQGVSLALSALDQHGGFLLADGTGVGKTRQELAVAKTYADQGKKVLIVTKSEVIKPNWAKGQLSGSFANDAATMGQPLTLNKGAEPIKPGEVHITTYDRIGEIKSQIDKDTVIIYDESHSLKNWGSARAKHGYEAAKSAGKVLYATATPADKPLHIAHLFRAKVFGDRSWDETYRDLGMRQVEVHTPNGTIKKWEIDPKVGAAESYRRIAGLFDRMTEDGLMVKREISFDGVDVGFERIALPPEAHEMLERIAKESKPGANKGLEKAMILMHQRRQQEPYKIPHVVDSVVKELAEGRQAVVFVSRVSESEVGGSSDEAITSSEGTAKTLRDALEKAGITDIVELHGASKTKAPKAMEEFQSGKGRVMIATIESGGTGINLDDTAGDKPRTLIMMTAPFSGVENVQAAGRVWRLKTKSLPRIRYVFGDTEVDRWNSDLIAGKMKTLGAAVGGEVSQHLSMPTDVSEEGVFEHVGSKEEAKEPFKWRPLISAPRPKVEPYTGDKSNHPLVHGYPNRITSVQGDKIRVKTEYGEPLSRKLGSVGGRWNGDIQRWEVPLEREQDLRALLGPAQEKKPETAPIASAPAAVPPAKPERFVSEDQRSAIHQALRHMAGNDEDRARMRNDVGFNKMDADFGAQLASAEKLTDRQAAAASDLLRKYHRQIPPDLLAKATTFSDVPAQKKEEPAPKTAPSPARSSISTRTVKTQKGDRTVHSFTPGQKFWGEWKRWKDKGGKPEYISVSKNPRTGDWEVSVWGNSTMDVERNVEDLRKRGVDVKTVGELHTLEQKLAGIINGPKEPEKIPATPLDSGIQQDAIPAVSSGSDKASTAGETMTSQPAVVSKEQQAVDKKRQELAKAESHLENGRRENAPNVGWRKQEVDRIKFHLGILESKLPKITPEGSVKPVETPAKPAKQHVDVLKRFMNAPGSHEQFLPVAEALNSINPNDPKEIEEAEKIVGADPAKRDRQYPTSHVFSAAKQHWEKANAERGRPERATEARRLLAEAETSDNPRDIERRWNQVTDLVKISPTQRRLLAEDLGVKTDENSVDRELSNHMRAALAPAEKRRDASDAKARVAKLYDKPKDYGLTKKDLPKHPPDDASVWMPDVRQDMKTGAFPAKRKGETVIIQGKPHIVLAGSDVYQIRDHEHGVMARRQNLLVRPASTDEGISREAALAKEHWQRRAKIYDDYNTGGYQTEDQRQEAEEWLRRYEKDPVAAYQAEQESHA